MGPFLRSYTFLTDFSHWKVRQLAIEIVIALSDQNTIHALYFTNSFTGMNSWWLYLLCKKSWWCHIIHFCIMVQNHHGAIALKHSSSQWLCASIFIAILIESAPRHSCASDCLLNFMSVCMYVSIKRVLVAVQLAFAHCLKSYKFTKIKYICETTFHYSFVSFKTVGHYLKPMDSCLLYSIYTQHTSQNWIQNCILTPNNTASSWSGKYTFVLIFLVIEVLGRI